MAETRRCQGSADTALSSITRYRTVSENRSGYEFLYCFKRAFGADALRAALARRPRASNHASTRQSTHPARSRRSTSSTIDSHGPSHHSPPSRRPDPQRSARRHPASRAHSVAPRWPPATLDPGHRRASSLVVGSVALPCPLRALPRLGKNAGKHAAKSKDTRASQDPPTAGSGGPQSILTMAHGTSPRVVGSSPTGPTRVMSQDIGIARTALVTCNRFTRTPMLRR